MENLPEARQDILSFLKRSGGATVRDVADHMASSYEAARQQLAKLENDALIEGGIRREDRGAAGRPATEYRLTSRGEDLFPKAYDELAVELIDTISEDMGPDALRALLKSLTDARVARWKSEMEGLNVDERLDVLQDLYVVDDPHTSVERNDGELYLVERNCPFLNIASKRPALCSVTVSTLQRLLGYRIERVEKFQKGHGRCVFRVCTDQPLDDPERFEFEGES